MAVIAGRPAVTESGLSARFIYSTGWRSRSGAQASRQQEESQDMDIHITFGPLLALIAGILILLMPKLLNFIVALYLILIGVVGIFGLSSFHIH